MCDKQRFKDVFLLAELGACLADQSHNPVDGEPDPFTEKMLAGLMFLEEKVDKLASDTANIAVQQKSQPNFFASIVESEVAPSTIAAKSKTGVKGKKPPPTLSPKKVAWLTLSQLLAEKAAYVELSTDAGALTSRASKALKSALQEQAVL